MDSAYYLSLFLDEAREKLHHVGQLLHELELEPTDGEKIAHVFREIHSFKGNADTMGFADLTELAHAMEHVLEGLRAGTAHADSPLMRVLGRALTALEQRLADVEAGRDGALPEAVVAELTALAATIELPVGVELAPEPASEPATLLISERGRTFRLEIVLDSACIIKGTRAFMITTALEMLGAVLDVTPSLEELDWPEAGDAFQVLVLTDADPATLRAGLADIGEIAQVAIHEHVAASPSATRLPLALGEAERATLAAALAAGQTALVAAIGFMPNCRMPGARALLAVNAIAELGTIVATSPSPEVLEGESPDAVFSLLVATSVGPDRLRDALFGVGEVLTVSIEAFEVLEGGAARPGGEASPPSAPASAADVVEGGAARQGGEGPHQTLPPGVAAFPEPASEETEESGPARRSRMLRIASDRFDDLMELAEQLSEANARVSRLAQLRDHGTGPLAEAAADAVMLAQALREELGRLRRVPIEAVFNRFPRMVRELAHELGKQVGVQVLGGDVEVDRSLADELSDVLVHLLRNAVDHGLETPAERHAASKGAQGALQLAARKEGGVLIVTVADDGRGVDAERVAQAAVERGRLSSDLAERLEDGALVELIFAPGVSTALATTRISGRGVGLDAVKSKVESLGGRITVESTPGRGTIFQLRFPLREGSPARPDARMGA